MMVPLPEPLCQGDGKEEKVKVRILLPAMGIRTEYLWLKIGENGREGSAGGAVLAWMEDAEFMMGLFGLWSDFERGVGLVPPIGILMLLVSLLVKLAR